MNLWNTLVNLAGLLATPVLAISYIPQVIGLFKSKNADGISLSFWYILDTSLIMLFIMALDGYFTTGNIGLALAQGINLLLALIVTIQVLFYRKRT